MTGESARRIMPAVVIVVVTWVLLALAQGIPTICALAYPCPAPDVRAAPAVVFGGLMLVPLIGLVAVALRGPTRLGDWIELAAYVLLIGLAVVGVAVVLFSGGFALFAFGLF